MQVACTHCGERYDFDAAAIPAAGYDAQCTRCNQVFFVAPEPQATISATCRQCGARYEFAPAAIPAEGYDAQCTHCQAVFYVSRGAPTSKAARLDEDERAGGDLLALGAQLGDPNEAPEGASMEDDF